jgi:hypothetical protein
MAIHSDKNLYPGINPHLNSRLQKSGGGWKGFHNSHLTDIARAVDARLPSGYYIANEQSLQVGTYDAETLSPVDKPSLSYPDIAVFREGSTGSQSVSESHDIPTLTLPLLELIDEPEEYIGSLVIYRLESGDYPGAPVTRIELLSPANKAPGSDYGAYLSKRAETLYSGVRLVEIDYLHERRPVIPRVPSYPDHEQNAYPYHIIVSDPRPNVPKGKADIFRFGILDPLPTINIPLDAADTVAINFNEVYQLTFESVRVFRTVLVDYEQAPINFDAYTPADRDAIRERMAAIAEEHQPSNE